MGPSATNNKYQELNEKEKRAVLGACLAAAEEGEIPHGGMAKIARKLAVSRAAVSRLWRAAKSSRLAKTVLTPDVQSKKKGNEAYRKHKLVYDREQMREEILAIPLWKRSTVRNLAHELKMPRSTVQAARCQLE